MSFFRLKGHELVDPDKLDTIHPQLLGHIAYIKRWLIKIGAQELLEVQTDNIAKVVNIKKEFVLNKWSMDS